MLAVNSTDAEQLSPSGTCEIGLPAPKLEPTLSSVEPTLSIVTDQP